MKYEIERKFLVITDIWNNISKPAGYSVRQGYILNNPEKTIRVRVTDGKGYITIKGITKGISRLEYEFEIPEVDANEILSEFSESEISKIRYKILINKKEWVVDEFLGFHKGLVLAEIELDDESEKITFPDWIGKEVSGDEKYYNSNLSKNII